MVVLLGQGSKALAPPCPALSSPALALPSTRPARAQGSGLISEKPQPEAQALGSSPTLRRWNYHRKTPKSDQRDVSFPIEVTSNDAEWDSDMSLTSSSPGPEPWPSPALPKPVPEAQVVSFWRPCLGKPCPGRGIRAQPSPDNTRRWTGQRSNPDLVICDDHVRQPPASKPTTLPQLPTTSITASAKPSPNAAAPLHRALACPGSESRKKGTGIPTSS
ncbi:hypothetical protein BD410DRAFT_631844 [Rickenella mellea]|uniref:Uncharacterized protein n=1 Tax=Rickenella mellea TaxID=50990 RepID=A0A4Y7QC23_9AGAM|nr:hypothetical protein BD410DRAFT_631844 [Rickenella mellea]